MRKWFIDSVNIRTENRLKIKFYTLWKDRIRLKRITLSNWIIWIISRIFKGPFICECGNIIKKRVVIEHINAKLARKDMACLECYYKNYDHDDYHEDYDEYYDEEDEGFPPYDDLDGYFQ